MQLESPELICVDPAHIDEAWPFVRELIQRAIDHTGLSDFEDIERAVLNGEQLLWFAWGDGIEAAAVTQLTSNALVIVACSGHDRRRWIQLKQRIEEYALEEGCDVVRIFGRKGWERVLDDYHVEHVVLEKRLGRH